MIIAIDGPAASGKSTTAKLVAEKLNLTYIDTGAMYRAAALFALNNKIKISDNPKLKELMEKIHIKFKQNGREIFLNHVNVSKDIRTENISKLSSAIGTIGFVRRKLVQLQREMGRSCSVVLEGRDIGSVVFPKADFKFFIVADVGQRAKRRFVELKKKGLEVDIKEIKKKLVLRDKQDSTRDVSPLVKIEDAIEIDTTYLNIAQQVGKIVRIVASSQKNT